MLERENLYIFIKICKIHNCALHLNQVNNGSVEIGSISKMSV